MLSVSILTPACILPLRTAFYWCLPPLSVHHWVNRGPVQNSYCIIDESLRNKKIHCFIQYIRQHISFIFSIPHLPLLTVQLMVPTRNVARKVAGQIS